MKRTLTLGFGGALSVALCACDGGGMMMMDKPDTTCNAMPAAVTMTQLHMEILNTKCRAGCHEPGPPVGTALEYGDYSTVAKAFEMVNKTSRYAGAAGTLKIVDTTDKLANSALWLKVSAKTTVGWKGPKGELTGSRMPNDGTTLSADDLKKVKDWICRGAPM